MYHSIQIIPESFGLYPTGGTEPKKLFGKNTWDDWHLIPSTRPLFNPPSVKTNYIDVPGMNGSIDLSTVLSDGYPVFGDRSGSQEFYVMNGYKEWYNAYSDIMNYCHGRKVMVVLEDEPSYFYVGRISVNGWKSEKDWSKITLDYTLEPYKYELYKSVEDLAILDMDIDRLKEAWRWDPFSFVDGIIYPPTEFGDPTLGTIYDFQLANSTTEKFYEIKLKDRTYPSCPAFELTNLGHNDCRLDVNLYYYRGHSGQTELWTKIGTQAFLLEASDTEKTLVGYNLILQDYSQKYGWKWEPKMRFGISCHAANQSIGVKIDFRRGKL